MTVRVNSEFKCRDTLGPAYNEFGYNEHRLTANKFLCIKIIDSSVKKFGYYEHPLQQAVFFVSICSF